MKDKAFFIFNRITCRRGEHGKIGERKRDEKRVGEGKKGKEKFFPEKQLNIWKKELSEKDGKDRETSKKTEIVPS